MITRTHGACRALWALLLVLPPIGVARARSTMHAMSADEAILRDGFVVEMILPAGILVAGLLAITISIAALLSPGQTRRDRMLLIALAALAAPMAWLIVCTMERIGYPGRELGSVAYALYLANMLWVALIAFWLARVVWPAKPAQADVGERGA